MHVGHARSFLLAWWSARSQFGELALRIEDLDRLRAREEWREGILEDLRWLGIDWDGEVELQSEHLEATLAAASKLLLGGHLYPCICSRSDVRDAVNAPHGDGLLSNGEVNYPGTCRGRFRSIEEAEQVAGRSATLRFQVPDEPVVVVDAVCGTRSFSLRDYGGDFVAMRRDAQPAYQLGVVVEDARLGVTEVLRGDDLLVSAARQQLIQGALGLATPRWLHVPLVHGVLGERLEKRAGSTSLAELRSNGMLASDLIAWVARSVGMEPLPKASAQAYLPQFSLDKLPKDVAIWGC